MPGREPGPEIAGWLLDENFERVAWRAAEIDIHSKGEQGSGAGLIDDLGRSNQHEAYLPLQEGRIHEKLIERALETSRHCVNEQDEVGKGTDYFKSDVI